VLNAGPSSSGPRALLVFAAISAALVLVGHVLVLQRMENGPTPEFTIGGDTGVYVKMIEQGPTSVHVPFRYRPLGAWLAGLLPTSPVQGLRVVTYASLFGCYFLVLWICRRQGLDLVSSFAGLFAAYSSIGHLYNYHNPFLTDGLGLFILFLMLLMHEAGLFVPFLLAGAIGVLARESALFLAPLWLARKEWAKAAAAISGMVAVYVLIRLLLKSEEASLANYFIKPTNLGRLSAPGNFTVDVFLSWRNVWLMAAVGAALMPVDRFFHYLFAAALLFAGAFISSVFAADLLRMFQILAPCMVVFCAWLFRELWIANKPLAGAMAALLLVQLFMGMPTVITERESWVFATHLPRLVLVIAGIGFFLATAVMLRGLLKERVLEKVGAARAGILQAASRLGSSPGDKG